MDAHTSILCLDLGTHTGWALRTLSGNVCHGTQDFTPGRYDGGGMRYLRFTLWLDEVTAGVQRIAFEEVRRHSGTGAAHVYGGFMATLEKYCEENKIPYEGIPVGTIKKSATGKGNAGKPEMMQAARDLGYDPVDDNAADALHMLLYVEKVNETLKKCVK